MQYDGCLNINRPLFFYKNLGITFFLNSNTCFLYILPASVYTFAITRATFIVHLSKTVCDFSSSHRYTKTLTSSSALNRFPPRTSLRGPNRWRSLGARSGLQVVFGNSSQCIFSNVPVFTVAVCGHESSWRIQTFLSDCLRRFEQRASFSRSLRSFG
jgi:hypothetical protein